MAGSIHIGTSGWSYKHWKGIYYPPNLPARQWLSFYTNDFNTTEINSSFYRIPTIETVQSWISQVPQDFVFCPKMSRFLSHMKKLRSPEEPLERFFAVFEPMKNRMGPVLIQLPSYLHFNYDVAEYFYKLLATIYRDYRFVMEVRHSTWLEEVSLTLMSKYNIGFVISQSGDRFPYSEMVTAQDVYVRFHGPAELYASSYSNETLMSFAEKFRGWQAEDHNVWAYFNNDIFSYAPADAKRLIAMLKK
jgi:uncharacterized protein YecE (DUF72 family)